jgi:UTP--glucose-1-phosphate uridylyltransferase
MRDEGVADAAVRTFADQVARLRGGERGLLAEQELEPVGDLPALDDLPDDPLDASLLDATVVVKLNGGLGTSMGLTGPKSLLPVKEGRTFLDVVVQQVLALRRATGARLPLLLLHSFATREPSLAALSRWADLPVEGVPLDVLQSKVPKLRADDLSPVSWPADPGLEWAPPGHGDLYVALQPVLADLLAAGLRWAFVSNVDNLGAVLDPRILGWVAREEVPFLMEVATRTAADRKGGHLARRRDGGGLVLREVAQCPEDDLTAFQDVARHRWFNTNSLWVDLRRLQQVLAERDGVLGLPLIVNRKTVDPTDASSTPVVQLETAMGAAIDVVDGAQALAVPRSRFAPVKTTDDLLVVRSDAYRLEDDGRVVLDPSRERPPLVRLDPAAYKLVDDFDARFPAGPPSLVAAGSLEVRGDVTFGAGVVVRGDAVVEGPAEVTAGAVLGDGATTA